MRTRKILQKLILMAGFVGLSLSAVAFNFDATITIDQALNSPTLTVRYTGATAALAELILNGDSYGTRVLDPNSTSGETNFTLTTSVLNDGENQVEIKLFDADGKLVGSQRTTVYAEKDQSPAVYIESPKVGETVQGPVELKVGFARPMQNVYVSFFVDSQFKLMTNFPPYTYTWDTMRTSNGWHQVEAWVVDESSATFKTKKVRVFVNNPSGNTARIFSKPEPAKPDSPVVELAPSSNPDRLQGLDGDSDVRPTDSSSNLAAVLTGHSSTPLVDYAEPIINPVVSLLLGDSSNLRLSPLEAPLSSGFRHLLPTGTRIAPGETAVPLDNPAGNLGATGDAALKASAAAAVEAVGTAALEPRLHPVISVSITNPMPTKVSGDLGLKPAALKPETGKLSDKSALAVQPSLQPVSAPAVALKKSVKPVAKVEMPAHVPSENVSLHPVLRLSKTVTTVVRVMPGVRIPHEGSYAVVMDGKLLEFDVQPRVEEGVPMAPFRHLIEKHGGTVDWHGQTKSVTANDEGRMISLKIGTKIAEIDHAAVEMDLAPYIEKGRTIVPLSFMRESLHVNIDYDKVTNHVLITSIKS